MTKHEIRKAANAARDVHPMLRYGQAIFNAVYKDQPQAAERLIDTKLDCFHEDGVVESFLDNIYGLGE